MQAGRILAYTRHTPDDNLYSLLCKVQSIPSQKQSRGQVPLPRPYLPGPCRAQRVFRGLPRRDWPREKLRPIHLARSAFNMAELRPPPLTSPLVLLTSTSPRLHGAASAFHILLRLLSSLPLLLRMLHGMIPPASPKYIKVDIMATPTQTPPPIPHIMR